MEEFQEVESLLNDHFGRLAVVASTSAETSEAAETSEWVEEDGERPAAVERLTNIEYEEGSDRSSDSEDPSEEATPQHLCSCQNKCLSKLEQPTITEHINSIRSMNKEEKEMYIMGTLGSQNETKTRTGKRKRATYNYNYHNSTICRKAYLVLFDIGNKTLKSIKKHMNVNGRVPRVHGLVGKRPKHSIKYEDARFCVDFIVAYGEMHGVPQPAAPRGRDDEAPVYLHSSTTKIQMHQQYKADALRAGQRALELTAFKDIWSQCIPHIKIASPKDDVCAKCEVLLRDTREAVTIEGRLEASTRLQTHLQTAKLEHGKYIEAVQLGRTELLNKKATDLQSGDASTIPWIERNAPNDKKPNMQRHNGPMSPNTVDLRKFHYTFDFSQMVTLPHHPRQMGPLYFVTGSKIQIFGVRLDSVPRQYNYLIDENETIGANGTGIQGPNGVISMLHDCLFRYGFGEKGCVMHADNCAAQNKNQYMMAYLAWRVIRGLHDEITLMMQVPGHTRCLVDGGFGHVKRLFRRSNVESIGQLSEVVNKASYSSEAVLYNGANEEPAWQWYDWKTYLRQYFLPLKGISKYATFSFKSTVKGYVFVRETSGSVEMPVKLVRDEQFEQLGTTYPSILPAAGISPERAAYLYKVVRPYVSDRFKQCVAPPQEE